MLIRGASWVLLFSLLSFNALAQKDTEFWFVAPEITQNNPSNFDNPVAFRFSTYGAPAVVRISQPANPAFPVQILNIAANTSGVLQLPPLFQFVENTPANTVLNKGFLIESTSPITAYYEVIGTSPNNPELFSLKGRNALGTTFYTPFQNVTGNSPDYTPLPHAAFDIVATEDNTLVTITPTRAIVGHAANLPFNINLNRGQTYSGEATSQLAAQHPTGSKIVSNKPIAVTVKDDLLEGGPLYGGFCRDLMGDQIVPVEKLGTRYVVHKGLLNGDEFAFIVATQNATQIKLDGILSGTINAGQQFNLNIDAGGHFIESSAPVYVLQMTGNNCELAGEILPALDCSGSSAVRFVRSTDEPFFLFLTTRSGFEAGFALNGNAGLIQASDFQIVPGSSGEFVSAFISFSNIEVSAGASSVVTNNQGLFQLGILNGAGSGTGCRFGFFSDFGNKVVIENNVALCPNDSIEIEGQQYTAPATVSINLPGVNGACDTVAVYELVLKTEVLTNQSIALCPGQTVSLGGQNYTAPDTVSLTLAGSNGDCDTLATYYLTLKPQVSISENIALCPGQMVSLGGQDYTAPDTVNLTLSGSNGDCDTLATYNLTLKPQVLINENIALCPGQTVSLGGQNYTAPSTINLTFNGLGADCDTLATYNLTLKPQVSINENIALCPGQNVSLGGQNYSAPATVNLAFPGLGDECDTLATYNLILKPQVSINENIGLCPGQAISLGGQNYIAPATVNVTYPGVGDACDTLATYNLTLNPQSTTSQTIEFCPGETITLGGTGYTQPTTVVLTLPATVGCDTIATYILKYLTPAPSNVSIACPANVSVITPPGTGPFVVYYPAPTAATDCPCPGIALTLTAGLPSGSLFPPTSTPVCWQATDSCGQTASCCFVVTVREELPCDIKTIGCMKYELLSITADPEKNRTYRIRATNFCANKMTYTAIQIPDGMVAMSPANNSIYTAPTSGREYLVRNPNYSPSYSVRFKSTSDSISNGEFDVFRYTLPAQADVTYIHIVSRLEPQVYYEAHMNTFNCPIGVTPPGGGKPGEERADFEPDIKSIRLFPNPTSGALFADFSAWAGQDLQIRVMDSRGQTVLQRSVLAGADAQSIGLPETLPNGLYFLEIITSEGGRQLAQFVRVGE